MNDRDLELAVDELLLDLADVDEDDEVRAALIRDECLDALYAASPEATFDGMQRDDAIFVLEWSKKHGSLRTAAQLRDGVRKVKGELARRDRRA
jgi:hypothetical protein